MVEVVQLAVAHPAFRYEAEPGRGRARRLRLAVSGPAVDQVEIDVKVARHGHLHGALHRRAFAAAGSGGAGPEVAEMRADVRRPRGAGRESLLAPPHVQERTVARRAPERAPDAVEGKGGAVHEPVRAGGPARLAPGRVHELDRIFNGRLPRVRGPVLVVQALAVQIVEDDDLDREPPRGRHGRKREHRRERGRERERLQPALLPGPRLRTRSRRHRPGRGGPSSARALRALAGNAGWRPCAGRCRPAWRIGCRD